MTNATPMTPPWAAQIWVAGDWLYLDLPSAPSFARHTTRLPNDEAGLRTALALIRSRTEFSKLGTAGDLTQHQIDRALTRTKLAEQQADFMLGGGQIKHKPKPTFQPSIRNSAKDVLRKLGMI